MASGTLTPSEYIGHHLTFDTKQVGEGAFWMINVDSLAVSLLLGVIGIGFLWWVVRGATAGVPNKRQAFVELFFVFIDDQVKGIFLANQLSSAISALELAVSQEEDEGLQDPKQISLRQRSLPMLKMLKQCLKQSADVVWGV